MDNQAVHIEAKITRPKQVKNLIKRKRLTSRLEQCTEALVVFHAAMGYGKTVFMNEWKDGQTEIKKAWYHISYVDNDQIVFMEYLAAAVERQLPGFCFALDPYKEMEDERYACERMGAEFCQALGQAIEGDPGTESLILMLDGFQEIVTDRVAELMESVLRYLPESVRVFMSTKGALPWFTDRQRLQGDALVVTAVDLAFDEEETKALAEEMKLQVKMDGFSSWVWEYTEGWPAGIMLIYLYVRQNQGRMAFGRDSMAHIYQEARIQEFLMYNLFRKLPYEIQGFLKGTALLEYLTGNVCNAVMGIHNSEELLNCMLKEGLFIQRVEGEAQTCRYHSLFRRFLIHQLSEEERKDRLEKIAWFFLNSGVKEQAAEYAILAGNGKILDMVVGRAGAGSLEEGRVEIVGRWLQALMQKGSFTARSAAVAGMYYWKLGRRELSDTWFYRGREMAEQAEDISGYLFVLEAEVKTLQESGRYRDASGLLGDAMENRVKRYSRYWFELACQEVANRFSLLEEEKAVRLLREMVREKETESRSVRTGEIKEAAKNLLSEADMDSVQAQKAGTQKPEGYFHRLPVIQEWIQWKCVSAMEKEGRVSSSQEAELLAQLKPAGKSTAWGLCSRILLGYGMYRQGQGARGGTEMTKGMLELRRKGFPVCLPGEAKRVSERFYLYAKAGGCLREGEYHLIAECFGGFGIYVLETGEKISWRTKKARECVALLLQRNPKHLSREELLLMLWDEEKMPRQEVANLHNLLSSIRKSLLPFGLEAMIQYQDKKYFLKDGYIVSDIPFIRELIRMVRDGDEEGVWERRGQLWEYRSKSYLAGMDRLWAREERSYVERWMYEALMMAGGTAMGRRDYREAEQWYIAAMEAEPFLEAPVLCLFQCLGRQKDIQGLRMAYGQRKEFLEKETGEKLSEAVEAAYQEGLKECGRAGG